MGPLAIGFGVATFFVVCASILGPRPGDRLPVLLAALILAAGWGVCRMADLGIGWGASPRLYGFVDMVSCCAVVLIHFRWGGRWPCVLAVIFAVQSVLHLVYQTEWMRPGGIYPYIAALNVLYALALAVVLYAAGPWRVYRDVHPPVVYDERAGV